MEALTRKPAPASVKQHPAVIRMQFDRPVVGQILSFNQTSSVRGPKHVVKKGKMPVLTAEEARGLLDGIDLSTLAGLSIVPPPTGPRVTRFRPAGPRDGR